MSSYALPSSMASRTGVVELAVPTSNPASRSTAVARALTAGSSATTSTRGAAAGCRPEPTAFGAASRAATAPEEFARATAMTWLLSSTASCRAVSPRVRLVPAIDVHRQKREDVAENHAVQHVLDQGGQGDGPRRIDRCRRQGDLS